MGNNAWKEVASVLARIGLPALGAALLGPAGGVLGETVAAAIGADPAMPDQVAAKLQADPEAFIKLQELEAQTKQTEIIEQTKRVLAQIQEDQAETSEVNATMRTEDAMQGEGSLFRAGWRPAYGWMVTIGIGWWSMILGILVVYTCIWHFDKLGEVLKALGDSVNAAWGTLVALLAVLGVNVKKRSDDKAVLAGVQQQGLLSKLGSLIRK